MGDYREMSDYPNLKNYFGPDTNHWQDDPSVCYKKIDMWNDRQWQLRMNSLPKKSQDFIHQKREHLRSLSPLAWGGACWSLMDESKNFPKGVTVGLIWHNLEEENFTSLESLCIYLANQRWKANEHGWEAAQKYNDYNIRKRVNNWINTHTDQWKKFKDRIDANDVVRAVDAGGNTPQWKKVFG